MSPDTPVKEKNWGVTRPIRVTATEELHHASIRAGGFSSRHRHRDTDNPFDIRLGCPRSGGPTPGERRAPTRGRPPGRRGRGRAMGARHARPESPAG